MTIQELVENKTTLNYQQICTALIETFHVNEKVNWESVLPAQQQQEYFGGETLRLIAEHPILSKQKDIRPIALKKGSISQMLFFYICLQDSLLPKKNIQELTKKFISGGDANRYIIWFFGNKENTDLKIVLSGKEGKKIVLKTLTFGINQPYYKTYNFILNEVSQKVNQLFVEPTDLWKALWKAFDISIINRNFYNEIKDAFTALLSQLNKKANPFNSDEDRVQFAIRLIGRIIFCWFLKRKNILGDEAISSNSIKLLQQKNYYQYLLEPLFFDVLNTPQKDRKSGLPKTIANYPFLNGGLFEPQKADYKDNLLLDIDNEWFYALFSKTLEKYNFTVDENSSSNSEIAIDPEMLGRIFENLLAEQNPETGESARKATGSYYTPREIVDYMVEQSIVEFLKTALELGEEMNLAIDEFVHTQILPATLEKYEEQLSEELNKIKVLDPACGSGAFPIGILQKIIALKQQLHPKIKNYKLKLDTIQNSIYGVDIQPMAVELSRLRCWLSLVVDEEPNDIKALPNLDFKFVCANTLIPIGNLNHQLDLSSSVERIKDLKELRTEFFVANGKRKKDLENKFKTIQISLNNNFLEWDGKSKMVENLASWKPFDNQKTDWFDPFWMFGLNNGFDVVIGNPPYYNIQKFGAKSEYVNNIKKIHSDIWMDKSDILFYFIKLGIDLCSKSGSTFYIISNAFLFSDKAQRLRNFILKNAPIENIVNFEKYLVFENAMITTAIVQFKKDKLDNVAKALIVEDDQKVDFETIIRNPNNYFDVKLNRDKVFALIDSETENLNDKIDNGTIPLGELVLVGKGMETAANEVYSNQEILNNEFPPNFIRKRLNGKAIKKYFIDTNQTDNILYFEDVANFEDLPKTLKDYLLQHRLILEERATVKNEGRAWWRYSRPMHKDYYHLDKIWTSYRSESNCFAYDNAGNYIGLTNTTVIFDTNPEKISLKYLLALLNSKVLNFRYKSIGKQTGNGIYEYFENGLSKLPIQLAPIEDQKIFIVLVDYFLYIKKKGKDDSIHESVSNNLIAKHLEDIIDAMVLELYFGDEMKEKKINIIDLVANQLEKSNTKTIEEDIYLFYYSVSHPDNIIRNRILSFPLLSPNILKPILQV